ncbi:hypothetical protein [Methylobacterium nigriterrae]|uniref:hypothetical protein n=1 Tax=Methylobacterium nigriterrae TaxID=3127512 RepID=UPI0030139541
MSKPVDASALLPDDGRLSRYRVFILNADETVLRIEQIPAQDDDTALGLARAMLGGHALEIWDGMRFIEHLDPAPI